MHRYPSFESGKDLVVILGGQRHVEENLQLLLSDQPLFDLIINRVLDLIVQTENAFALADWLQRFEHKLLQVTDKRLGSVSLRFPDSHDLASNFRDDEHDSSDSLLLHLRVLEEVEGVLLPQVLRTHLVVVFVALTHVVKHPLVLFVFLHALQFS